MLLDCVIDGVSAGAQGIGNGGMDLERTAGSKLIRTIIIGRANRVYITHSNDTWTLTRNGTTYTTAGGSLEIVNPTNNSTFGNNGYLYIQTWIPYELGSFGTGNSMTYPGAIKNGESADGPDTSPRVHTAAGVDIPYVWSFDKNYVISSH